MSLVEAVAEIVATCRPARRTSFGPLLDGPARQWSCLGTTDRRARMAEPGPLQLVDDRSAPLIEAGAYRIVIHELGPGASLRPHEERHTSRRTRHHLAVATNPEAVLVVDGRPVHVPVGETFSFDPWAEHSAVNHGTTPRIHLVWDVPVPQRPGGQFRSSRTTKNPDVVP